MQDIDELLQAITALEAQRTVLGDQIVDAALAPLEEKLTKLEQYQPTSRQRRLVTVLFLDIVNSTLLSQGLEPEEILEIMGGALKRLSLPIESYGGKITQVLGDGFMAVFGLTKIHENDANQAVRSGLAILSESRACSEDLERRFQIHGFSVRIGINTGRVVAGKFTELESTVMGLTVSLAARLEQAAQPGTLLISQFTYQHIRGAFEVEVLSAIDVKGFLQPVTVYQVLSARPHTFKTLTRGVEGVETRFIGREAELRQLKTLLTRSIKKQETQFITVIGEAGVGKSRLLYEFDRWIAQSSTRVVAFKARSSPQSMSVPFGLLREMISYRLGLLTTDTIDITCQRLVDAFSVYLDDEPEMKAHFVAALLGFTISNSPYLQGIINEPNQLSERAQLYLIQYLSAVARGTITIFMLDDINWADVPSVNFIINLVNQCPKLHLLVVCLARPSLAERFPTWDQGTPAADKPLSKITPLPAIKHLLLEPLSQQASQVLLAEILGNAEILSTDFRDRILDNADGNPFYIEEYIQALLDMGAIFRSEKGAPWKLDEGRLKNLELPPTLIALLESRLDSLTTLQKKLVQQASVIGQIFWRSALQAVHGEVPIRDVEVDSLYARGFIYPQERSTFEGTDEYRFHHGLLREVAYQTLFKSDRKYCHSQVAKWLIQVTQLSGRAGEFAPVIAEHYESAGEKDLAAEWFTQSGMRAQNQGVPAQARIFFDRALNLLPPDYGQGQESANFEQRWKALVGRDEVLGILGDTENRIANDNEMVALAEFVKNDHMLADAYYHKGYYLAVRGQYLPALEAYNLGLAAAIRSHDKRLEAIMLSLKIVCQVRLGDLEEAAQSTIQALSCVEEVSDEQILARCLTNISIFYNETGDLALGVQLLQRQLEINRRTHNMEGEVVGLSNLGYAYIQLGRPDEAISTLARCIQMASTIGHRFFTLYGRLNIALAYLRNGEPSSALVELDQCLPELKNLNDTFGFAVGQTYIAFAKEKCGMIDEALSDYKQAATRLEEIGAIGNRCDAEAGIARCLQKLNKLSEARHSADRIWDYLSQHGGGGMEFPVLGYETCANIFMETGDSILAQKVIEEGYNGLMRRAEKISLPAWRQTFLEKIPEHHQINASWLELNRNIIKREEM